MDLDSVVNFLVYIFGNATSTKIIYGAIVVIISAVVSECLVSFFKRAYHNARDGDKAGSIFTIVIRAVVWAIGISIILKECFNIDPTVIWGALGVGGIAVSLGLQSTFSNLLGGLWISFGRNVSIGDWIVTGNVQGTVTDITIMHTKLIDDVGQTHVVPNSVLHSNTVTVMPEYMRTVVMVVIDDSADLDVVGPQLIAAVDKALDDKDMRFEGMDAALSAGSLDAQGIHVNIAVYTPWSFSTSKVKDVVTKAATDFLESNNIVGRWK